MSHKIVNYRKTSGAPRRSAYVNYATPEPATTTRTAVRNPYVQSLIRDELDRNVRGRSQRANIARVTQEGLMDAAYDSGNEDDVNETHIRKVVQKYANAYREPQLGQPLRLKGSLPRGMRANPIYNAQLDSEVTPRNRAQALALAHDEYEHKECRPLRLPAVKPRKVPAARQPKSTVNFSTESELIRSRIPNGLDDHIHANGYRGRAPKSYQQRMYDD